MAEPDGAERPSLVCLLPVRNGAAELPAWLDRAASFCDAVVALDDGSTDATQEVLRAHPIVAKVIANPRREGFLGWHDGVNRNRLLAGAAELRPDWIVSVDLDERLDPSDAVALREFVATDALPGCAYGFQWYRMADDERFDPAYNWVFRLFPFHAGQRFPQRRLDFVPVPTSIPKTAWVCTTLRIQHHGELDEAGRAARVAKYREADPEGQFRDYYERLHPFSPGPYDVWAPREPGTPSLEPGVVATALSLDRDGNDGPGRAPTPSSAAAPFVVAMLPARDCAVDLPGWFESVSRFADAVVALDDGSVDGTGDLLRQHPLVARLLSNPVRDGFAGWDDAGNRNRLLEAAKGLGADWVIGIDADERIPVEDGVALRRFLQGEARPGYVYGFPRYRMIGDVEHFDRQEDHAFRLFAPQPDDTLIDVRLHAMPIPSTTPVERLLRTSIRIQHLVGLTVEQRQARYDKFREADPDQVFEPSYEYARDPVGAVLRWPLRDSSLPVVTWPDERDALEAQLAELDLDGPVLTVALLDEPGGTEPQLVAALAMLERLSAEPCDELVELLLVTSDAMLARQVERSWPDVKVIRTRVEATPGEVRNASLRAARGDYVTHLPVPSPITPGVLDDVLRAHERGAGLVSGTAAPVDADVVGLAVRLLDITPLQGPGRTTLPAPCASYAREALVAIHGFDEHAPSGVEALATRRLLEQGFTSAAVPSLLIGGHPGASSASELLRQRFAVGRRAGRGHFGGLRPRLAETVAVLRGIRGQVRDSHALANGGGWEASSEGAHLRRLLAAGAAATALGAATAVWRPGDEAPS